MKLAIKPAPAVPELQKMNFRLPAPTVAAFEIYLRAYAETYGTNPDPDFVVNQIFLAFFASEKEFTAYLRENRPLVENLAETRPPRKRGPRPQHKEPERPAEQGTN